VVERQAWEGRLIAGCKERSGNNIWVSLKELSLFKNRVKKKICRGEMFPILEQGYAFLPNAMDRSIKKQKA